MATEVNVPRFSKCPRDDKLKGPAHASVISHATALIGIKLSERFAFASMGDGVLKRSNNLTDVHSLRAGTTALPGQGLGIRQVIGVKL